MAYKPETTAPPPSLEAVRYFPFPWIQYILLAVVLLVNELTIHFVSPMLPFLVLHLGLADKREHVGFHVGLIGSMYFLGRGCSSHFWGVVGDHYGRKIVVYISVVSSAILMMVFGWTNTYWVVLASRFLSGLFSGILGTARCMASELCHPRDQPRGQMFPMVAWQTGLIIGPSIGGYLAMPCSLDSPFSELFQDGGLFCTYPFLLPSLVTAFVHVLILPAAFALKETNPGVRCSSCCGSRYSRIDAGLCTVPTERVSKTAVHPARMGHAVGPIEPETASDVICNVDSCVEFHDDDKIAGISPRREPSQDMVKPDFQSVCHETAEIQDDVPCAESAGSQGSTNATVRALDSRTSVGVRLMVAQALFMVSRDFVEQGIPLFCTTPLNLGGLLWRADEIGGVYGFVGLSALIFSLSCGHYALERLGVWRFTCIGFCCLAPLYVLIPQVHIFAGSPSHLDFYALTCLSICRQCFVIQILASIAIATNNLVSPTERGRLQGAAAALQSLLQALVPVCAGFTFSNSVRAFGSRGINVTFVIGGSLLIANGIFWRFGIPRELDAPSS